MDSQDDSSTKPPQQDPASSQEDSPKPRKELKVVSVPDDQAFIDQEMADLFEEDQVTHKHGSSEPEGD